MTAEDGDRGGSSDVRLKTVPDERPQQENKMTSYQKSDKNSCNKT